MSGHSTEERFVVVAEARRRRTRTEKEAILGELRAAGATVSSVARKHNLSSSLLFRWRRELGDKPAKEGRGFLPVMLTAPGSGRGTKPVGPASLSGGLIEIELSHGRRIRVDGSVDVAALRRVIDILELR